MAGTRESRWSWASFGADDSDVAHAFRCPRCGASPASVVVTVDDGIPHARCRCGGCGVERFQFMTHLQALRLAAAPPACDWLTWESDRSRHNAFSRGIAAVMSLWPGWPWVPGRGGAE